MLTALPLNCTLKADPAAKSSTDAMIEVLRKPFAEAGVRVSETVRAAALNIKPGVTSDEGEGDDWPALRAKILAHDILIFGGPIWLGQVGSVAKRVLERMDAFLEKPTSRAGFPAMARSRSPRSSATRTARICRRRSCSRR
jgi:multimeric flavodoxin WrbA